MILLLTACDLGAPPQPGATEEVMFEVPAGATARGLADELAAEGLIAEEWRWEWHLRLGADGACIKAGRHRVTRGMTADELLAALCGVPVPKDEPFTVVEGWRIREIDAALAEKGWIQPGAYEAVAKDVTLYRAPFPLPQGTLEGYLYPETYRVEPDRFDPKDFVQRQLDTFAARFWDRRKGDVGARSLEQIVVMASLLEREEPTPANRPLVAGILWKRLDSGWNLGVDATSRYTLADWNDREAFLKKLRDPQDPWNTRLRGGLPPTPIGNPGVVALDAALDPVPSEYWFYLHDAQRVLHPSRNEAEHEAYRRKYDVY
ncbi:MAG: endolytic transglycosylase MltG [Myxococcota bacterium]